MRDAILNFFLLILGVLFFLTSDSFHNCGRFFKTLLEKGLGFVLCEGVGSMSFSSSLILLLSEIDLLLKK